MERQPSVGQHPVYASLNNPVRILLVDPIMFVAALGGALLWYVFFNSLFGMEMAFGHFLIIWGIGLMLPKDEKLFGVAWAALWIKRNYDAGIRGKRG